jgi:FkbM family methyltransferase
VDLYGQDAELHLLSRLVDHLGCRTLIDVGAEQGALSAAMLDSGVEQLHVLEPHPANIDILRDRFARDERVTVHEYAVSDADGTGELHVSTNLDGEPLPYGHTLLSRPGASEIKWTESIAVNLRSLESLVRDGLIPKRVGILKIDTEGHDLSVVRGMGSMEADVVMVEHWTDLPNSLGACPWSTEEMVGALRDRGFHHFAFIVHRPELVTLKWDDGVVEAGAMGNLVFVHDRSLAGVLPEILGYAGQLAEKAVAVGQHYMRVANDRLAVAGELEQAANDRLALVHELEEAAVARLTALESTTDELRSKSAELDALRAAQLDENA